MKKISIPLLAALFISSAAWCQSTSANPFPRTITVSGSAEIEIVPDEIYVNITLREYQKRGENKKDIETIKTQFLEHCSSTGIPDSVISIASYTGYNNYYQFRKRKKDPNLMAGITYQVKFKDSKTMDALVEKLDDEATQSFIIVNTSHSNIAEFRKQLKIKAVKAAKDKAIYLSEAINEKIGPAVTITEPAEDGQYPGYSTLANETIRVRGISSNVSYGNFAKGEMSQEVDFKKLRLRYEVSVVFSLQ